MFEALEEISIEKIELAEVRQDLTRYVHEEFRPFFRTYGINGLQGEDAEDLATAFATAVHMIAYAIPKPQLISIVFGRFPYIGYHVGTGVELYVADMSQKPLACANETSIYIHSFRLLELLRGGQAIETFLLEELIHAWMSVRDETIVQGIIGRLSAPGFVSAARAQTREVIAGCATES